MKEVNEVEIVKLWACLSHSHPANSNSQPHSPGAACCTSSCRSRNLLLRKAEASQASPVQLLIRRGSPTPDRAGSSPPPHSHTSSMGSRSFPAHCPKKLRLPFAFPFELNLSRYWMNGYECIPYSSRISVLP